MNDTPVDSMQNQACRSPANCVTVADAHRAMPETIRGGRTRPASGAYLEETAQLQTEGIGLAAFVNVGGIIFGGSSNQVGSYSGQNMQNGWDSNSPNLSLMGTQMGQMSVQWTAFSQLNSGMVVGQPVFDNDLKDNASPLLQGP